jgi:L-methionine (R)-S-oxide reductase
VTARSAVAGGFAPSDFIGTWKVRRTIVDRRTGVAARFVGAACVTAQHFSEEGETTIGQTTFASRRSYNLDFNEGALAISFPDGRPFIRIDATADQSIVHGCGDDIYTGRLAVCDLNHMVEIWRVIGPRKNYTSIAHFKRTQDARALPLANGHRQIKPTLSQKEVRAMFETAKIDAESKPEFYRALIQQMQALLDGENDPIANAANISALLFQMMPDLNWAGFYLLKGEELVLGPFQGKPACVRIPVGRGVCGTAVSRGTSVLVEDVHAFPGHIACDAASRSELVVPIHLDGRIVGVIDLDSPIPARFDLDDQAAIERVAALYVAASL